jgi:hypothetical protein
MTRVPAPRSLLKRICDACLLDTRAEAIAVAVVNADGHRGTAYASNSMAAQIEDAGFVLGEGPCIDALLGRGPVLVDDLSQPAVRVRWPAFTAACDQIGVGCVYAFPLQLGAITVGTLALYGSAPGGLDGEQLSTTLRAADDAVLALLGAIGGEGYPEQIGYDESMYRAEVYQASGMLAEQLHVSVGEAISRLRAHSFATDRPVDEVARAVVRRELRFVRDNDQAAPEEDHGDE